MQHDHSHHPAHGGTAQQARDPVCGMSVDTATAQHRTTHAGVDYYFCGARCKEHFEAAPADFLGDAPKPPPAKKGTRYTCPMHPEIIRDAPGDCPICGMALEPMEPTAEDAGAEERRDFTLRLIVSAALSVPLLVLAMGPMLGLGYRSLLGERTAQWIELALASPVVLWAAQPFFKRAVRSVANKSPNMWTLIGMGVGAAYLYSLIATLAPGLFPLSFHAADGSVPVYFEAASVIIALVFLGQVLELGARARTGSAIRALMDLAPKTARRIGADGSESDIPLEDVKAGDRLRIRPGESVPVDGMVIEGRSAVDESLLSGEPVPVEKTEGNAVTGGTINGNGTLVMRAEAVGSNTVLSQIVDMVAKAQRSRAPIQGLADKVAAWFVPTVLLVAIIAFITWATVGPEPRFAHALIAAVSVLIIACPCALGLATPMSIMTATGRGAEAGVLIKDAEALERMARVTTLIVDKTGTLTEGRPRVKSLDPAPGVDEERLLTLAASLEAGSEHPLAEAIAERARDGGVKPEQVSDFEAVTGMGVTGSIAEEKVALGNARMMEKLGIDASSLANKADQAAQRGESVIYVVRGHSLAGLITVADPIKANAAESVATLRHHGLHVVMATGDNERTARAVAAQVGIDDVHAGLLPEGKQKLVELLRQDGASVAMAGDGVNDAPALAAAEVGIAMGSGADVAVESAGITLLKGDISGIARARHLAEGTLANIKQNLMFAFLYNALGVPLAAGLLYPFTGTLLSPMIAAAAMSFSSVSVVGNALRLRRIRL